MTSFARRVSPAVGCAAALLLGACIIPDTQLRLQSDAINPGTVRLIQAVAVSETATDACDDASVDLTSCPLVPESVPFGAIAAAAPLCTCPGRDGNGLSYFDVYVEDPDVDDDGRPLDSILGTLLLDMPGTENDPAPYVAYPNLLPGNVPASNVNLGFNSYTNAIERPEPRVRRWTLGAETGVDLCNDNGAASDRKLEPGLHSLRLVVTDRPWYRSLLYDEDGEVMLDDDEEPMRVSAELASIGVPDLPAGATYATADYVFRCGDGEDPEATCNCVEDGT